MSIPSKILRLPDTMVNWPWPRAINPRYEQVKPESIAWIHSFKVFSTQSQYTFDKYELALLSSLTNPGASKEHLRSACDLMNLFYVIEEYTDVESHLTAREMADIVVDALKNPHKPHPQGEIILGEIARQFWESAIKIATETAQHLFIKSFTAYLESVVQQAADREHKTQHSIASYLKLRYENLGVRPSYALLEFRLNLPDEVVYHPTVIELSEYALELITLDNDMASYNREQAVGDNSYNILTVAMQELSIDLDGALDWATKYHAELQKKFLDGLEQLPSWGPELDRQLQEYLYGVGNWVRANNCWNFENQRYFGEKGLEVKKTCRVVLLPKRVPPMNDASLRRENVVLPLIENLECGA